ncbi:hypothetical protein [Nostoc sp.]|uniref:hypothetical protein n=1 Tax=Nostoc sp. TaxID=1180 RepID=UPI002FF60008
MIDKSYFIFTSHGCWWTVRSPKNGGCVNVEQSSEYSLNNVWFADILREPLFFVQSSIVENIYYFFSTTKIQNLFAS